MRALVWFRSDLRVEDNTALHAACQRATRGVVGVFCVTPAQWRDHDWGACKVDFVMRCVADLADRLATLNIPLRIIEEDRFEGVPSRLLALAEETGCDALFFNREYEVNEARRDEAARALFLEHGREARGFTDQTLLEPGSVRTNEGKPYGVFTPFRKKFTEVWLEREGSPCLGMPKKQVDMPCEPDGVPAPDGVKGFDQKTALRRPDLWKAGQSEAKRRLTRFCQDRIGAYKDKRDIPSVNGTSTLSPYLAAGAISPRQCVEAALDAAGRDLDPSWKFGNGEASGAMGWISELIWREFYKHLIVAHPRLCMHRAFQPETERLEWDEDKAKFDAWKEGRTGFPIVDAAMRQLAQTGWMHNRLRMISAMFLTKDLWLDWRWGERYFMRTLVDGDLASNNGGWQWSASTGTDAQPYFRVFNPTSQGERFDPDGAFIRKFVPELADVEGKAIHDPSAKGVLFKDLDYPSPIVDHKRARERAIRAFKDLKSA